MFPKVGEERNLTPGGKKFGRAAFIFYWTRRHGDTRKLQHLCGNLQF